jgi:hypothetical protein
MTGSSPARSNTIHDFLRTFQCGPAGITCPACGSPLALAEPGCFSMFLTESVRAFLNTCINTHRGHLDNLERVLTEVNQPTRDTGNGKTPYTRPLELVDEQLRAGIEAQPEAPAKPLNGAESKKRGNPAAPDTPPEPARPTDDRGVYRTTVAVQAADTFTTAIDSSEVETKFGSFPAYNPTAGSDLIAQVEDKLLPGLGHPTHFGTLQELIFEQEEVLPLKGVYANVDQPVPELVTGVLSDVCPQIYRYLRLLEAHIAAVPPGDEKQDEARSERLRLVRRAYVLLLVLLGDRSPRVLQDGVAGARRPVRTDLGFQRLFPGKVPYALPQLTQVQVGTLRDLLCSELLLSAKELSTDKPGSDEKAKRLPRELLDELRRRPIDGRDPKALWRALLSNDEVAQAKDDPNWELKSLWFKQIPKVVHFACARRQTRTGAGAAGPAESKDHICGWYPKDGPTYSVVLVGSSGTGKTSVLTAGLPSFMVSAATVGLNPNGDSPADKYLLNWLRTEYQSGRMPDAPTPPDQRVSVKLSVESTQLDAGPRIHFVFSDIAGERVQSRDGLNAELLQVLWSADTLVLFFDLGFEDTIRLPLTRYETDEANWKDLIEGARHDRRLRGDADPDSQFDVINTVLTALKERNADLSRMNCVCVFPKSDRFVDPEAPSSRVKFLTEFFMSDARKLLSRASNSRDTKFASLRSNGLPRRALGGIDQPLVFLKELSNKAEARLLGVAQVFDGDGSEPPHEITNLEDNLRVRLFENLRNKFARVYFLPVSARPNAAPAAEPAQTPVLSDVPVAEPAPESDPLAAPAPESEAPAEVLPEALPEPAPGAPAVGTPTNQKLTEFVFLLPVLLGVQAAQKPPDPSRELTGPDLTKIHRGNGSAKVLARSEE